MTRRQFGEGAEEMSMHEDLTEEFRGVKLEAECAQDSIRTARKDLTLLEVALGSLAKKLGEIIDEPACANGPE